MHSGLKTNHNVASIETDIMFESILYSEILTVVLFCFFHKKLGSGFMEHITSVSCICQETHRTEIASLKAG